MLRDASSSLTRLGALRLDERCLRLLAIVLVLVVAGLAVRAADGAVDAGAVGGAIAPIAVVLLLWFAARAARDRR